MSFEFYYGNEAEQFSFIRIPKALITEEKFAPLSIQAKMLYGILLDRMSLSIKNSWLDKENRVYIIYPIAEIQEDLGFSKKKAIDYLAELEKIGLVEKKRRGLGLPTILYVKNFISDKPAISRSVDLGTSGSVENDTSRSSRCKTFGSTDKTPQEVSETMPHNNTKKNNTNVNQTDGNLFISSSRDKMRLDEAMQLREQVRSALDIDILIQARPLSKEMILGMYELVTEILMSPNQSILIAGSTYPADMVKERFRKLDSSHLEYILDCLKKNTSKVRNIKKYLQAALFNAPIMIDSYYYAEVQHDMAASEL